MTVEIKEHCTRSTRVGNDKKKNYIFKNNWNKNEDIKLSAHDGLLKICYSKLLDRFIAKYIAADLWKKKCDGQQFYKYYQHK